MIDKVYLLSFYMFKFMIFITPSKLRNLGIKGLAFVLYHLDKKHRHIAVTNLNLAYENTLGQEEKTNIIKACYVNLGLSFIDFIQNQGISKALLKEKVCFVNEKVLSDALAKKEKIILMTAHYGNWELLPLSIAAIFGPLTGVGRKLDASSMDSILKQNREQFDIQMLDKKGAMRDMISVLKNNRMLGLLVDQNTSASEGVLVDFFGKPVRHTPSAAILARRFGAKIIPAFIRRNDEGSYTITFYEPIDTEKTDNKDEDIRKSVQKQAKITEEIIKEKPEEWFWLHKRWKNQFEECYN